MVVNLRGARVGVGVHCCYAGVVGVRDEVAVVGEGGRPLQHDGNVLVVVMLGRLGLLLLMVVVNSLGVRILMQAVVFSCPARRQRMAVLVVVLLLEAVPVHVLAKVGEARGTLEMVAVGSHHGDVVMLLLGCGPGHGGMALWGGGGVLTARVGHGVVELGGVDASLVRAALVLDHGGLSAEAASCQ